MGRSAAQQYDIADQVAVALQGGKRPAPLLLLVAGVQEETERRPQSEDGCQHDKNTHPVGMSHGHSGGLTQVLGTQYGLDLGALVGDVAPTGAFEDHTDLRDRQLQQLIENSAVTDAPPVAAQRVVLIELGPLEQQSGELVP